MKLDELKIKDLKKFRQTLFKTHYLLIIISTLISQTLAFYYFKINKTSKNKLIFLFFFLIINSFLYLYIFISQDKFSRRKQYYVGIALSLVFNISLILIIYTNTKYYPLYLYFISLSIYHYAEYFSVLQYHTQNVSAKSYLITQGKQWMICTLFSFVEFIIETFFFDKYKKIKILFIIGLIMTIIGQYFRISALFTGKANFTHLIQYSKKKNHILVKHGIYSLSRHPSYFGFYCWSVGIEIMCVNPICIISFTIILFKFFKKRILVEEELLIEFFGMEYIKYKNEVGILIPFIHITKENMVKGMKNYLDENIDHIEDNEYEEIEKFIKVNENSNDLKEKED